MLAETWLRELQHLRSSEVKHYFSLTDFDDSVKLQTRNSIFIALVTECG